MSDEQAMQITAQVMSDERPLQVTISIKEAWLLISALQLVCRHPGISTHMKDDFEHIARQFQDSIVEQHPVAQAVIEMGWDTRYDR